jgi:hypothetical protein
VQVKSLVNVYLHNNGLTGQIPSNFHGLEYLGKLSITETPSEKQCCSRLLNIDSTLAGALRLYNNDLTGDISPILCDLKREHSLSYLAADCKSEIDCTCCDKCY